MKPLILAAILATSPTPAPSWKLTPSGWGPAKIGMTRAQVSKALHVALQGDAFDNEGTCEELSGADNSLPGLYFMFEDGKLTRITASDPSVVATPRGIHLGSTAAEVHKAYGAELKVEPHYFEDPAAKYLTYWLKPDRTGVRFETDVNGKVETIHAGSASIKFAEGCA